MTGDAIPGVGERAAHGTHGNWPCACVSRRRFVRSLTAFGASAVLPRHATAQAASAPSPGRIDVHHHFFPPVLIAGFVEANAPVAPPARNWTVAKTIDEMGRGGVATSILSIPFRPYTAGLAPDETRRLIRLCNNYGAQLMRDHSGRFGLFVGPNLRGVGHAPERKS